MMKNKLITIILYVLLSIVVSADISFAIRVAHGIPIKIQETYVELGILSFFIFTLIIAIEKALK